MLDNLTGIAMLSFLLVMGIGCGSEKTGFGGGTAVKPQNKKVEESKKSSDVVKNEPDVATSPLPPSNDLDISTNPPDPVDDIDISTTPPPEPPEPLEVELLVTADTIDGDVDVVWVVDESGSMSDEVEIVNANLASFERQVSSFANIKNYLSNQNNWRVQSRSGPNCLLKGLGLEQVGGRGIGGIGGIGGGIYFGLAGCNEAENTGLIKSFYRQNSKKLAVFVTDDNFDGEAKDVEDRLAGTEFSDIIFYAFASPGQAVCPTQDREGVVYQQLADNSGGELFNLCESDWSKHYKKLTDSIRKLVISTIETGLQSTDEIIEVRLNGAKLDSMRYTLADGKITGKEGVFKEGDKITIKYYKKKS